MICSLPRQVTTIRPGWCDAHRRIAGDPLANRRRVSAPVPRQHGDDARLQAAQIVGEPKPGAIAAQIEFLRLMEVTGVELFLAAQHAMKCLAHRVTGICFRAGKLVTLPAARKASHPASASTFREVVLLSPHSLMRLPPPHDGAAAILFGSILSIWEA
jgi:hypothetical protein